MNTDKHGWGRGNIWERAAARPYRITMAAMGMLFLAAAGFFNVQAQQLTVSWADFTSAPATNRPMWLVATNSTPTVFGTNLIGSDLVRTNTGSNAVVVFPQVNPGTYNLVLFGREQVSQVTITITNGTPTNAALNAKDLTSVATNSAAGSSAYSMASADARFAHQTEPMPVVMTNAGNSFGGIFNGNGAGLTNLPVSTTTNASLLTTGTLADARLSTNAPLLNANQTFTGNNTVSNATTIFTNSSGQTFRILPDASIVDTGVNQHFGANQTNGGNTSSFSGGTGQTMGTNTGIVMMGPTNIATNDVGVAIFGAGLTVANKTNEAVFGVAAAFIEATNNNLNVTGTLIGTGAGLTTLPAANLTGILSALDASALTNINLTNANSKNLVPPGSVVTNDPLGGASFAVNVPVNTFCELIVPSTVQPTVLQFVINGTSSHDTTNGTTRGISVAVMTNRIYFWTNTQPQVWFNRGSVSATPINVPVYSLGATTNNYTATVIQAVGEFSGLLGPGTSFQSPPPLVTLSNTDIGQTSVMDFLTNTDPINAAELQWTNRGGTLYIPTNGASLINFTPLVLAASFNQFLPIADGTLSQLSVNGQNFGSTWKWGGTNAAAISYSAANPAINFRNITALNAGSGTNAFFAEASSASGGVGGIVWNNVTLKGWNIGAVIFNSVGDFYGLQNLGDGIGEFFPALSDGQIVHLRSFNTTNASLVFEGKGVQADYNAANDQIGIIVGAGGDNIFKISAENISNCVVAIGYPPVGVFPQQGLTVSPGGIGGNSIGWGYVQGGTSNAFSDGFPTVIKLYTNSQLLDVHDLAVTTGQPVVWSRVAVADTTAMTFDGVSASSNLVIFSDLSTIAATGPAANMHYGVNVGDSEYTGSTLEYQRGTNGSGFFNGPLTYRVAVAAKTSNYSVLTNDTGTIFNNAGAGGAVTNTLPAAAAGLTYGLTSIAASSNCFKANGTDKIFTQGSASSAGGTVSSTVTNSFLEIYCPAAGSWYVKSSVGTWVYN